MSRHLCSAYGLTIQSMIPLVELWPGKGTPDVVIDYGAVPESLPDAAINASYFQAAENQLLLLAPDVARFLIRNGDEIIVQPLPGSEERDVAAYLEGVCLAAVLHQRGVLPLHASGVQAGDSAVLFAGPSGSGKSTLAGAFLQRGYRMLTDDVAAIVVDAQGQPLLLPAMPRLKLWDDAAAAMGIDTRPLVQVYSKEDKYALPTREQFVDRPLPISHLFQLAPHSGDALCITPLTGWDRLSLIIDQTFRKVFLDGLKRRAAHLQLVAQVAAQVSFYRIDAPRNRFSPHDIAATIERDILTPFLQESTL